ncbi:MAG TPA: DNA-binding response regulator [Betaproteobacteria bacterium]|nr:DNA-binding response regulator [Betaproteobacteria bacterium]
MRDPIKIMLIDDHTLFRMGLAELLEQYQDIEVIGIAGTPDEARLLLNAQSPDVVLMDLHIPPTNGIDLFCQLRKEGFATPTLILTVSDAEEDLASALRAGVQGYLLKDMEPDTVVSAIRQAVKGETVVAPGMTQKLVELLKQDPQHKPGSGPNALTQRERQILSHLAQGESNKVIARALDISHDTVKLHVRHILSKLSLSSRVEAAVFAVEHKLVQPRSSSPDNISQH